MPGRFIFDERFAEAIFHAPRPHRVLGQALPPFSTWHKVQLEYANSPFFAGGTVEFPDLELAVGICQTRYPHTFIYDPPTQGLRKWLWLWRAERTDLHAHKQAFEAYLHDYLSPPKLWATPKKKGKSPARLDVDDSISEVAFYVSHFGGRREDAWDMPIGELKWMNVCGAKSDGANVRVWTPSDERAFREHLKRREAAIAKLTEEYLAQGLSPEEAAKAAKTRYWATVAENKKKFGF